MGFVKPIPEFISKILLWTSGATAFKGITIKALSIVVGQDLPKDRKLCPVRALKIYLHRTQNMREGKKLLFISTQPGKSSDICKNTITGWIKALLKEVYTNANQDTFNLVGFSPRAIRGMTAS